MSSVFRVSTSANSAWALAGAFPVVIYLQMAHSEEVLVAGLLDAQAKAQALFAEVETRKTDDHRIMAFTLEVRGVDLDPQPRCAH